MNTIKKLFIPSGRKFYELFEQVAANLQQMSALFSEHASETDRKKRRIVLDKIERMENKNDEATHKLFVELGRNFITPFDREDIHYMATSLDDVADMMWGASKQMYHYDILENDLVVKEFAANLVKFTGKLENCLHSLHNRKGLNALIAILNEMRGLTSASETAISKALSDLFNAETSPIEMIKMSDHYNILQALNNKCGDVINVLEGVIIKYA